MNTGHYILGLISLVSAIGIVSIIIDMFFTRDTETYLPSNMSKQEREAYFDEEVIINDDE